MALRAALTIFGFALGTYGLGLGLEGPGLGLGFGLEVRGLGLGFNILALTTSVDTSTETFVNVFSGVIANQAVY